MTSKQRAYLKGLAMNLDPVFQIGKSSVTPENIVAISEVFHTHELIKIAVLKNCIDDPKEIANTVAERTHSQVVQVIGKKFVLYKPFKENPKIVLPTIQGCGGLFALGLFYFPFKALLFQFASKEGE